MSEVFVVPSSETLESLTSKAQHIVIIKQGPFQIGEMKTTSAISTTDNETDIATYSTHLKIFEVQEVVYSNSIKNGSVSIFEKPDYSDKEISDFKKGISTSPIVKKYQPKVLTTPEQSRILFLKDDPTKSFYILLGEEGLQMLSKVKEVLSKNSPTKSPQK